MTDYHTHIGQFYNIYTSPSELLRIMDTAGVERFATSSTSICEGDYNKTLAEMRELWNLSGDRLLPVLWIIPPMLKDKGLQLFLDSEISWAMLKIHPQLNPTSWGVDGYGLNKVLGLAKEMHLPLLIHTGECQGCYPHLFESAIMRNPDVIFILAHGRPLDETINLLQCYPNVLTDTAFMPLENVAKLCLSGLANRILWGTDIPIPKYYDPAENLVNYCRERLKKMRQMLNCNDYKTIITNSF